MDLFEIKKAELDEELKSASPNVGIAFGTELFNEFLNRGWLTLETFGALGTTLFSDKVHAYQKTHVAFSSLDIEDLDFKVGRSESIL